MSIRDFEDVLSYKRYGAATVDFTTTAKAVAPNTNFVVITANLVNVQSGQCPGHYDAATSSSGMGTAIITAPWNYTLNLTVKEKYRPVFADGTCDNYKYLPSKTVVLSPNESLTFRPHVADRSKYACGLVKCASNVDGVRMMYGMEIVLDSAVATGPGANQSGTGNHRYIVFYQKFGAVSQVSQDYGNDLAGATNAYNTLLTDKAVSCYTFLALEDWSTSPHTQINSWTGTPPASCTTTSTGPAKYMAYWWNKANSTITKVGDFNVLDTAKTSASDMLVTKAYGQAYVTDAAGNWLWYKDYVAGGGGGGSLPSGSTGAQFSAYWWNKTDQSIERVGDYPTEKEAEASAAIRLNEKASGQAYVTDATGKWTWYSDYHPGSGGANPDGAGAGNGGDDSGAGDAPTGDVVPAGFHKCSNGSIIPVAQSCNNWLDNLLGGGGTTSGDSTVPLLLIGGVGIAAAGAIAYILLGGKKETPPPQ